MGGIQDKSLSSEQISDARRLCEVIKGVKGGKRPVFEIVMLAYMNGMEAGVAYVTDLKQATQAQ